MPVILSGDARQLPLPDASVDLIVTSPPYFGLRSYTDGGAHYQGQIGSEPTPQEFLDALLEVTAECVRVLKPSGSLFVNLGDKYNSAASGQQNGHGHKSGLGGGRHDRMMGRGSTVQAAPAKSLMLIPERYRIACVDQLGLALYGAGGKFATGTGRRHIERTDRTITGYACGCPNTTAPTTPGVVLDPFGGTGTTALVATMHGRRGITVDLSADYCRLAQWRASDPKERARAAGLDPDAVAVIKPQLPGQTTLFDEEVPA
jgi:hypothetical protein